MLLSAQAGRGRDGVSWSDKGLLDDQITGSLRERLIQIFYNVIGLFNADADSDQFRGDPGRALLVFASFAGEWLRRDDRRENGRPQD